MEYKHLLQWHSTCTHKAGIQNYGNQMESGGKQKKKSFLCSSSNSHYLALQGLVAHHIQKEERSNYLFCGTFKKTPKTTKYTHKNHTSADPQIPDLLKEQITHVKDNPT